MFSDPVVAADGHTYEREAIEGWLENHDTSPMTNHDMLHSYVFPNIALRKVIATHAGD